MSKKNFSLLLAGDWLYPIYERAAARGLIAAGLKVHRFSLAPWMQSPLGRVERRLGVVGPTAWQANSAFLQRVERVRPSLVMLWRNTHLTASTLERVSRQMGIPLVSLNNDDPFPPDPASWLLRRQWRVFAEGVPVVDLHFAYRESNLAEFRSRGARRVELLRSCYLPWLHYPCKESREPGRHVVFVGHWEDDGRGEALAALHEAGLPLRIHGDASWKGKVPRVLRTLWRPAVYGDSYREALHGAAVALCFLSARNRDTYTRRNFEIPACGTAMLSQRTDDLLGLFREGHEAEFFSSSQELVAKTQAMLSDRTRTAALAMAGHRRVCEDRHDVYARMGQAWASMRRLLE